MNLVFICTPGNTGSSLLTTVFARHGFATASNNTTPSHRKPFGSHENSHMKLVAKLYIKERGGDPWAAFGGADFVPGDDWPALFQSALRADGLTENVVLKASHYLWLKDKMPPARWVFAYRRPERTIDSMFEKIASRYQGITREDVRHRVEDYFAVARRECEYTVDMDAFVKGDSQGIPDIMRDCGVKYDKPIAESVTDSALWRF